MWRWIYGSPKSDRLLGTLERGPTRKRVLEKVVDYVETFIRGVAA